MADCFSARSRRLAQLEDDLAGQQAQLNTLRKALSKVVDVAIFHQHKEQVVAKLANKADLDLLDKHYTDLVEVHREQLSEALANKADATTLELRHAELAGIAQDGLAALERRQTQFAERLAEDRASAQDAADRQDQLLGASRADLEALEGHQEAMAAKLAAKADADALAEQERRLERTENLAQLLEATLAETTQQHTSYVLSAEMSSEARDQASTAAIERQRNWLEATRLELSKLECRFSEHFAEQTEINNTALAKQDEWYKEKDHEQYLLAMSRKERQDEQLVVALSKKADVAWYEQQKAMLDATQVSLTALNGSQQELLVQLMDKVDACTLEKQQRRLQQEIAQARQDTSEVSRKLDRHHEHLDMARAQLLEVVRLEGELEVSLSMKADKAGLERQEEQLEALGARVIVLEQRQDIAQREVEKLKEQLSSAAKRESSPTAHPFLAGLTSQSPLGTQCPKLLQPPQCPRERGPKSPRKNGAPYMSKRKT